MFIELGVIALIGAAIRYLNSDETPVPHRDAALRIDGASPGAPVSDSQDGHVLASELPPKAGAARNAAILALAQSGQIPTPFLVPVTFQKGGHAVEIFAAADALKLGSVNPVRLTVPQLVAQQLADYFGMVLPTSLMSDAAWLQAAQIQPQTGLQGNSAGDTATFVLNSDRVDAVIAAKGIAENALVRPVGKDWVNTERLIGADGTVAKSKDDPTSDAVANFGWHMKGAPSRSPGGQPVIQSVGLVHNIPFQDYSQVVSLYGPTVIIDDGAPEFVVDVLRDPSRAYLLSDEVTAGTAARVTRHPDSPLPPNA